MADNHISDDGIIRLDTATLEARAAHYPEKLREPFVWLGSFLRDECAKDIDILVTRAAELGITTDKTNWAKILRGRLLTDAKGHPLSHPIVNIDALLENIETLRKEARIKDQSGSVPFVLTPTAQSIFNYIDKKRAPDRVNKFGVIIGETGTGKTGAIAEYCLRNNHGTCTMVDSPEKPSMYKFITDLAARYGAHPETNMAKKHHAIIRAINKRKTVIVENVQRLWDERARDGNQPIFSFLQKLQEDTRCTIIITFTPTFERRFTAGAAQGFFEQFEGRAGGSRTFLRLPEYPTDDDIRGIAEAFGIRRGQLSEKTTWPRVGGDVEQKAKEISVMEYLRRLTRERGRIRILFETLQEAKIAAQAAGDPLTITHLKEVRERTSEPNQ